MKKISALLFLALFVSSTNAEQLPSLKPMATPTTQAITILDAPNKNPQTRFTAEKKTTPKPSEFNITPYKKPAPTQPQITAKPAPKALQKAAEVKEKTITALIEDIAPKTEKIEKPENHPLTLQSVDPAAAAVDALKIAARTNTPEDYLTAMHLYLNVENTSSALTIATYFNQNFTNHPRRDEALYTIATLSSISKQQGRALQQLKIRFENSKWTTEAAYQTLWNYAKNNTLTSQFTDPRAKDLKQRQEKLPNVSSQVNITTIASIIPGGGYAYQKEFFKAFLTFALALCLLWALSFAILWGQLPYAITFTALLLSIYGYSIQDSRHIAQTTTEQERTQTYQSWEDLRPKTPQMLMQDA